MKQSTRPAAVTAAASPDAPAPAIATSKPVCSFNQSTACLKTSIPSLKRPRKYADLPCTPCIRTIFTFNYKNVIINNTSKFLVEKQTGGKGGIKR